VLGTQRPVLTAQNHNAVTWGFGTVPSCVFQDSPNLDAPSPRQADEHGGPTSASPTVGEADAAERSEPVELFLEPERRRGPSLRTGSSHGEWSGCRAPGTLRVQRGGGYSLRRGMLRRSCGTKPIEVWD
jgi:hypothetical protein